MKVYSTEKESQALLKKHFSPGESQSPSQDLGGFTRLDAENSSGLGFSAFPLNKEPRENEEKGEKSHLESLSANSNSSSREELELELDFNYISPHFSPQSCPHQYLTLYCSACGYRWTAPVKCSEWRLCKKCRSLESYRVRSKYLKMINEIPREKLRLVTLTTRNVEQLSRQTIQTIRSAWLKLLRLKRYKGVICGGLYSIEVVNHGRGWNVHMHALCEVKEQNMLPGSHKKDFSTEAEKQLSRDWLRLTKQKAKIVDIEWVWSPHRGLFYILKDFMKGPGLSGLVAREYLEALKSSRLISTFGKWYHKVRGFLSPHRFECPSCNNDIWVDQYFLRDISEELQFARAP